MKVKIKKLSTNRFKINGVVYKRIKSTSNCAGCHFYRVGRCTIGSGIHCYELNGILSLFYHLIPNEL